MDKSTKRVAVILAFCILVTGGWAIWQKRIQIASVIWQLRHRGLLTFAGYSIPVPKNWYVQDAGSGDQLLVRFDSARTPRSDSLYFHATVLLMGGGKLTDVNKWKTLTASSFKSKGSEPAFRSLITADGEVFSCVGGEVLPRPSGTTNAALISWHCRSGGSLEALFTASPEDTDQIREILSRARRATIR